MRYKLINGAINDCSFNYDLMDILDEEPFTNILLKIPNLKKSDVLEYFECAVFELCEYYELDMSKNEYDFSEFDVVLRENTPKATFASEFYGVMGQLFLGGMIDFGVENGNLREKGTEFETNLSRVNLGVSLYEKWVYFRDNYFLVGLLYKDGFEVGEFDRLKPLTGEMWRHPVVWTAYTPWICMTPLGQRYYSEVLLPRIYEKYKDIEVEVGENGEILGWFKNGVKM